MTRTFLTLVSAILAAVLVAAVVRYPQAEAAARPSLEAAAALPGPELPSIQAPFDTTPITPVESAGAPMYD